MKTKLLLIALALIGCNDNNSKNETAKKSSVSFEKVLDKYNNGIIRQIGTNRIIRKEKDTLTTKIGHWAEYYPNGKIRNSDYYSNEGLEIGQSLMYYENGRLENSLNLDSGKYESEDYSIDGKISSIFIKDYEKQVSLYQIFYPNGSSKSETIERIEMNPDDDGNDVDTTTFTYQKNYYLSGVLLERIELVNGKRKGKYSVWDENGNLVLDTIYK